MYRWPSVEVLQIHLDIDSEQEEDVFAYNSLTQVIFSDFLEHHHIFCTKSPTSSRWICLHHDPFDLNNLSNSSVDISAFTVNFDGLPLKFTMKAKLSADEFDLLAYNEIIKILITSQTVILIENRWAFPRIFDSKDNLRAYDRPSFTELQGSILATLDDRKSNSILLKGPLSFVKSYIEHHLPDIPAVVVRTGYLYARSYHEKRSISSLLEEAFKTTLLLQPAVLVFDDLGSLCYIKNSHEKTYNDVLQVFTIYAY